MDMFDEARAIRSTMELCHLTQSELARQLGVSQSYVANKLRLLSFSAEMTEKIKAARISERHARALLRLTDESEAERILAEVADRSLTVRECEALVDSSLMRSIPDRLGQSLGGRRATLEHSESFRNARRGGCETLSSAGIDAHARDSYLGEDLYITVVIKDA